MSESDQIKRALAKRKKQLIEDNAPCILCGHGFGNSSIVDLVHLIRKSDRVDGMSNYELQTSELNTGLGHRTCHEIFDDKPSAAVNLPKIFQVLDRIKQISPLHYERKLQQLEPHFKKRDGYEYRDVDSETYDRIFNRKESAVKKKLDWSKRGK